MTSPDGLRHYRIMMAVPPGPPPPGGFPVVYVLDGNAFFGTMVDAVRLEAFMAHYSPAVVVGLGYDTPSPIAIAERNYDYTPPTGPAPEFDERNPERRAGGAEEFTRFLTGAIMPEVARRAAVDPTRRVLFGHSYGGLYAAYAYLQHPGLFRAVIAASPSLWYHHFHVLETLAGPGQHPAPTGRLLVTVGENEQKPSPEEIAALGPRRVAMLEALRQVDSARRFTQTLRAQGADATFTLFADETHPSVVPAAISRAVRFALAPAETHPEGVHRPGPPPANPSQETNR
ncbi:alpha/beta hydrolase-fold protein [Novosphingobium sp. 1949]|uniref:Alpha/beta hydrolase-fold protein n=1 Tax=Novosphingobium organovorum TaxID=2930092 RepID=A0ABT0BHS4_9SPHN|nr:alpha/beta fold hydrolase [Novosphingobium organovorum]MCJ2184274.1 alpha/beta hydrolase-fold protein [Novosphingobium organovorum]